MFTGILDDYSLPFLPMKGIRLISFFSETESIPESPFIFPTTALAFSSASGAKFPIPEPIPEPAITPTGPHIAPKPHLQYHQ